MKLLCDGIRCVEKSLGSSTKIVTNSERKNKIVARKSIVAKENILAGDIFSEENLIIKRPGNGISPMNWYKLIGKRASRNFSIDELIIHDDFPSQEI